MCSVLFHPGVFSHKKALTSYRKQTNKKTVCYDIFLNIIFLFLFDLPFFDGSLQPGSEKAMAPHSSTLAWKIPWMKEPWQAAVHGVAKNWIRLSDFTFTFHFHALEKEMATHSSVLAWRIPGMGELGGLPSMGSHGVGHD